MQRVVRVLINIDEGQLDRLVAEEGTPREGAIKATLKEFEQWCGKYDDKPYSTAEFLECEEFCPKCESTDLEWKLSDGYKHRRDYRCTDCEHEFTEKEMIV